MLMLNVSIRKSTWDHKICNDELREDDRDIETLMRYIISLIKQNISQFRTRCACFA